MPLHAPRPGGGKWLHDGAGAEAAGMTAAFPHGPLTTRSIHLCVDMQRLFAADGVWPTPWMDRVLPGVSELAGRFPERTVFTRFMPPERPEDGRGAWRHYFEAWPQVTLEQLDPEMIELVAPLARLTPPAVLVDRTAYSAFAGSGLFRHLRERGADGIVVSGAETDVCVVATVLAAVDLGLPVLVLEDGVCSSSDAGHDALMDRFRTRLRHQVATATVAEVLASWR